MSSIQVLDYLCPLRTKALAGKREDWHTSGTEGVDSLPLSLSVLWNGLLDLPES